jgi:probable HAF family extracellular repeat protein
MRDLGTLGSASYGCSVGLALNNKGDVVGWSGWSNATMLLGEHAFLYANEHMVDLNDLINPALGVTLYAPTGINDQGQIVANGGYGLAIPLRPFLLTPVPEPGTLTLLATALLALGVCVRRRVI